MEPPSDVFTDTALALIKRGFNCVSDLRPPRDLFERLAAKQHPLALFATCSDSRISPEMITQSQPGDLFVLRNAGNIVPPKSVTASGEGATVEFAVTKLGIHDIVVCGHSDCGAMKAVLSPQLCHSLPRIAAWLSHAETLRELVRERVGTLAGEAAMLAAAEINVLMQLENLQTHPTVAAGLAEGRLRLHGWVYKIHTGEVLVYRPKLGKFVSAFGRRCPGTARGRYAAGQTACDCLGTPDETLCALCTRGNSESDSAEN